MNAARWVARAVGSVKPALRASFAEDPLDSLVRDFGLQVRPVAHLGQDRGGKGSCDGVSFIADGVILYSPTQSRRQNFTLAHELAHYLLELDDGFQDMLAEQVNPRPLLETVCDSVAQELLVPAELIDVVTTDNPVRARHLIELFDRSTASLHASAIALARRLPSLGAVVVLDREHENVRHASVQADQVEGWPKVYPWRDQAAAGHPLLAVRPGADVVKRVRWRMPWGDEAEFFANALGKSNTVIAVLSDRDLWTTGASQLNILREYDERPLLHLLCCGQDRWIHAYPCPTCGQPFCPKCGKCRCGRDNTVTCDSCGLLVRSSLVVDGICVDCR